MRVHDEDMMQGARHLVATTFWRWPIWLGEQVGAKIPPRRFCGGSAPEWIEYPPFMCRRSIQGGISTGALGA